MNQQKERIPNKPVLGKGLASLLPQTAPSTVASLPTSALSTTPPLEMDVTPNKDRHPGISMCGIEEIVPNQYQPRRQFDDKTVEELAQSIKENGLIQPLIVRKAQKGYQLIAGERRLRAAKLAGLKQIPIVIRRTTDREALELALIENIQREDLNCIDTASAYQQLMMEFDLTQERISEKVGKDRASVANYLRLLKLPQRVQSWLKQGTLTFGHGKALAGLEDSPLIEKFATEVVDKKWSVRELESQIQAYKDNSQTPHEDKGVQEPMDPLTLRLRNIGQELSQKFSTKVQLRGHDKKGKIIIEYFSADDLNRILDNLNR